MHYVHLKIIYPVRIILPLSSLVIYYLQVRQALKNQSEHNAFYQMMFAELPSILYLAYFQNEILPEYLQVFLSGRYWNLTYILLFLLIFVMLTAFYAANEGEFY